MLTNRSGTEDISRRDDSASTVLYGCIAISGVSVRVDPVEQAVRVDGSHANVGGITDLK